MAYEKVYTKNEIKEIIKMILGKTFGEINNFQIKADLFNKGSFGHILEEDVFHYGKNSKSAPDFESAGIELKMTPYKMNKNGTISAKERLVLNIINYMEEYKHEFYDSHFWYKNKQIQLVWYKHEDDKLKKDFRITHELLFKFPEEDLNIIINDWYTIINKIKAGKAHELSEADTMYLGACTKGLNASSVRKQPFSDIMAKQRAFCLKTSYMTQLVRWYIGKENLEKVCPKINDDISFEQQLNNILLQFKGKSVDELCKIFNINSKAKNKNEIILARMLGIKGKVAATDEFLKANIVPKTIVIESNGKIKESMSFPTFKFTDIVNEEWETSRLFDMFSTTKYMFVVFKKYDGDCRFEKVKFWNMPIDILDTLVKDVWCKTKDVINYGNIVSEIKGEKRITNFPKMSNNPVCHVRPHGNNAEDTYPLPVADLKTGLNEYTKHCFWLNSSYVLKIISED